MLGEYVRYVHIQNTNIDIYVQQSFKHKEHVFIYRVPHDEYMRCLYEKQFMRKV